MKMDLQTESFLNDFNSFDLPPMEVLPIDFVRQNVEAQIPTSDVEVKEIHSITIPGQQREIPLRIYIPNGDGPFPVLVTFHGGGWIFGSLDVHDPFCRDISSQASMIVVSVDYCLAPEHKFPAPLEDCYLALTWTAANIHKYRGDTSKLVLCGDSAGGNLAAALTLMTRDRHGPNISFQVLIYPVVQHRFNTPSYEKFAQKYFLTKSSMEWFWSLYLPSDSDGNNPYASPLFAKDFAKLPPALIILAEFDPLHDEGKLYAQKLEQAGVPIMIKSYPSIHPFVAFAHQLSIGKTAIGDIAKTLHEFFHEQKPAKK